MDLSRQRFQEKGSSKRGDFSSRVHGTSVLPHECMYMHLCSSSVCMYMDLCSSSCMHVHGHLLFLMSA